MQVVYVMYDVNDVWSALQMKAVLIAGPANGIPATSLHLYIMLQECRRDLFSPNLISITAGNVRIL
jgi:hypothetical protein